MDFFCLPQANQKKNNKIEHSHRKAAGNIHEEEGRPNIIDNQLKFIAFHEL